ncbi:hypothetical protein GCK32_004944, partial [Trichostrongylus colubriformis]
MYTKVRVELTFSEYTSQLIKQYPPNKLQFPIAPQVDKTDTTLKKRSGEAVEKEVHGAAKVTSSEKQREK